MALLIKLLTTAAWLIDALARLLDELHKFS